MNPLPTDIFKFLFSSNEITDLTDVEYNICIEIIAIKENNDTYILITDDLKIYSLARDGLLYFTEFNDIIESQELIKFNDIHNIYIKNYELCPFMLIESIETHTGRHLNVDDLDIIINMDTHAGSINENHPFYTDTT
jgi:hypothetical protein